MAEPVPGVPAAGAADRRWAAARRHAVDLGLLAVAFVTAYVLKKRALRLDPVYLRLFAVYAVAWAVVHLAYDKFSRLEAATSQRGRLVPFVTAALYLAGLVSLYLYLADLFDLSRFVVYGAVSMYLLLGVLVLSGDYLPLFTHGMSRRKRLLSSAFIGLELSALSGLYAAVHRSHYGLDGSEHPSAIPFFYLNFVWILSGLVIHRFQLRRGRTYWETLSPHLQNLAVVLCCSAAVLYVFKLTGSSPRRYLLPMLAVALVELVLVSLYHLSGRWDEREGQVFRVPELDEAGKVDSLLAQDRTAPAEPIRFGEGRPPSGQLAEKLGRYHLTDRPEVLALVRRTVVLESVDLVRAEVVDSDDPSCVRTAPDGSLELFLNLRGLDAVRHLDRYLAEVNRALVPGGVFVGRLHPCELRRLAFVGRYPRALANVLYFLDFLWWRVLPRLLLLRTAFDRLDRGRRRVLPMAEGLGRLCFAGFEIVGVEKSAGAVSFTVRKTGPPRRGPRPSCGPLLRMRRTGKDGRPITVYKLRTMHPYSEYLQGYVTALFGYGEKGKVRDDFRVTAWGRFLRRFWLDEVPQLFNLLRGDLALVGVRPLSDRFLANYPEWLRRERSRRRPGCIPPYVAYRAQRVDEYIASEIRYLEERKARPVATDLKVLFLGLFNIVFNRIRSE